MKYSISELSKESGVTARTIRYYISLSLLQPPRGTSKDSWYEDEHKDRLAQIKELKEKTLTLQEIRFYLNGGDPDELSQVQLPFQLKGDFWEEISVSPDLKVCFRAGTSDEKKKRV